MWVTNGIFTQIKGSEQFVVNFLYTIDHYLSLKQWDISLFKKSEPSMNRSMRKSLIDPSKDVICMCRDIAKDEYGCIRVKKCRDHDQICAECGNVISVACIV